MPSARKKSTAKREGKKSEDHGVDLGLEEDFSDIWDDVPEATPGEVSEGKHQARIESVQLTRSKASGRRQVNWKLVIASGDDAGTTCMRFNGLEDEQGVSYLRSDLARLGVEWPKLKDLPETLESLVGTYCQITVKRNGEHTNIYFDKALDDDEVDEELEELDDEEEEEDFDVDDEGGWAVGHRCAVDYDGELFSGEINDIDTERNIATVAFDDGSEEEVDIDDLLKEEDDETEEESEGGELECQFEEKNIAPNVKRQISSIARKRGYDPDDYETFLDLLCDMAEEAGISGKFSTAPNLLEAIKKA